MLPSSNTPRVRLNQKRVCVSKFLLHLNNTKNKAVNDMKFKHLFSLDTGDGVILEHINRYLIKTYP